MTALDISTPFTGLSTSEDQWRDYIGAMISDGTIGSGLVVSGDSTGMQVKVSPDVAFIRGQRGESTATKTLPVTASDPSDARIDLVVLRNTFGAGFSLEVIAGTPSGAPVAEAPVDSAAMKEVAIGTIAVAAGVATIHAGDVTSTPPPVLLPSPVSVADAASLPGGAFAMAGAEAYTRDKNRKWIHDGTNWIITGGVMPSVNINRLLANFTVTNATTTTVPMGTSEIEVEDTDGFKSASSNILTIPVGFGGYYLLGARVDWAGSTAGTSRGMELDIAGNSGNGEGDADIWSTGAPASIQTRQGVSQVVKMEAGATATLKVYQNSGGNLDLEKMWLQATMLRHIPTLT